MPSAVFETSIRSNERPQTYALDRKATGIDCVLIWIKKNLIFIITCFIWVLADPSGRSV
jgi:hypothetical protein